MDFKPFLYLITADQAFVTRIREQLLHQVDFNIFSSLPDCSHALAQRRPDALIIDTRLPTGDAYAWHRELRNDFDSGDIPQLLLCSEKEVEHEFFSADDFLCHPFSDQTFLRKLTLLGKSLENRRRAAEQMSYAQSVAMTAMSSMGELGVVMEFMSKSFSCRSIQAVGELALNAVKQYDLDCIIAFNWDGDSYMARTDNQPIAEIDREHLAQLRPLGRLLELNGQLVVNFEHTSILVRQMPDDTTRCGRLRDNIATLCEGIESRVAGLLMEQDNLLKQQGIRYAVCEIRDSTSNLYQRQMHYLQTGRDLIGQVTDDFEDAFMHLGLMHEVENQLIGQLVTLRQRIGEIWSEPCEVEARLRSVVAALETLAGDVGAE